MPPAEKITTLQPCGLSRAQVSQFAESVATRLNFGPGADMHELVARLGGEIQVRDFLGSIADNEESIHISEDKKFTVYVPAHTSIQRDRFTVAHELGHYFLHYLYNVQVAKKRVELPARAFRYGSDRIEWEANWFAASFLMPQQLFKSEFARAGGSLGKVAARFVVSTAAAKIRASSLALTG